MNFKELKLRLMDLCPQLDGNDCNIIINECWNKNINFLEGEVCGVRACLNIVEHESRSSNEDLAEIFRNMIDQLLLGVGEDVSKSYLNGGKI